MLRASQLTPAETATVAAASPFGVSREIFPLPSAAERRFRFDRAVTLALADPICRLSRYNRSRVPILMYHGIRDGVAGVHPYFETNTSPAIFRAQMRYLAENGFNTISVREAREAVAAGRGLKKNVVITFDDGYRDFYRYALPVLEEYGFKATMFVVSRLTSDQAIRIGDNEFMSWSELRDCQARGTIIGSHSTSHPELYGMIRQDITAELRESKEEIEQRLGSAVRSFAYPFAFPEQDGRFVAMLREILHLEGYEEGVCTILGTMRRGQDEFFLPRIPVNSYDDNRLFAAKLAGSYDWLHAVQYLRKRVKNLI